MIRKASRIVAWILGILVGIFLILWLLLQIPAVQNMVVNTVTQNLSKTLNTRVSIDYVTLKFFKTVALEGIYVEDQQQDTLLYAKEVRVNIGLLDLLRSEIHLNQIGLQGAKINLHRPEQDTTFNYQFLIDAFASDTPDTTTSPSAWTFGIDDIVIQQTDFRMQDVYAGTDLVVNIGDFETEIDDLQLDTLALAVSQISLTDSKVAYRIFKAPPPADTTESTAPLTFPDLGMPLTVDALQLANNTFIFHDRTAEPTPDAFDFSHMNLQNIAIGVKDFEWQNDRIAGNIQNIAFQDHSGFELTSFVAAVTFTPQQIDVQNFTIETPKSSIQNNTTLTYANFAELAEFTSDIQVQLSFENSQLAFQDLGYFAPSITETEQLNTELSRTINLTGTVNGTLANLENILLNLSVGNALRVRASGSMQNVTKPEQLRYNLSLRELSTSYDDLKRLTKNVELPGGLDSLGRFKLSGRFRGDLNTLNGQNVQLTTESYTALRGDLKLENLTQPDSLHFYLNVQELRSQAADLEGFVEGGLPPEVDSLGQIRYRGEASGTTQEFVLTGELLTDAGTAIMDVFIGFNKEFTDAEYEGEVDLRDFELDRVLADTSLGPVTLAIAGAGRGLNLDSLRANLEGVIVSAEYQNYIYKNIRLDGEFNQREFIGNASMEDPNLQFAFQGDVDLNDSIPIFQFTANIDTVNLQQLNIYPSPLSLSGKIVADLSGNTVDNLDGRANIQNFAISNQTTAYQTDTITLRAFEQDTGRTVALRSDFLNASLRGDFKSAELPNLVQNFINDYFPIDQLISPKDQPEDLALEPKPSPPVADQNFEFSIQLNNPVPLLNIFVPDLNRLDTAFLVGNLDSKNRSLKIRAGIPDLEYQSIVVENIALDAEGTPQRLRSEIRMEDLQLSDSLQFASALTTLQLGNDSLSLAFSANRKIMTTDTSEQMLAFGGTTTQEGENYRFVWDEKFVLNNNDWQIPANNEILYRSNFLDINNFALSYEEQELAINSTEETVTQDFAPLKVAFSNFELAELFQLGGFSPDTYKGKINGEVVLRQIKTNLNYLVDLQVNDILLYNEPLGDLMVEAEQPSQTSAIVIDSRLSGPNNDASVSGTYALADNSFDLTADLERLELRIADPFSQGLLEESEGIISGNFTLDGSTDTPAINGNLMLDAISTTVGLTKVRYHLPQQEEVRITSNVVEFGEIVLEDSNNNPATLSGVIRHENFANIDMDLNFNTDRFQVLNTTVEDEDLYYGTVVTSGDVDIQGSPTLPRIDVQARTLLPTQVFVQPLTVEEATTRQEDYVIFDNPATYAEDTSREQQVAYRIDRSGISLSLNLEVTSDAELQIIIDPATGDKLVARGNSELTVEMDPSGEIGIVGNYRIVDGQYTFNYQGLTKRNFEIREGSRLEFVGDPYDTRFNVTAIYTTRTPTYELIRNQVTALSDQQVRQSKNRTPVNVVLNMRGDLNAPEISFDIQLPEAEGSPVTSVVQQSLVRLRDNPTELNKQVFGLLLFNSFFSEEQSGGSLADAGSSIYLSSVSNLVSNQLNRLAEKYVQGVDINVGVESYQSDYALEDSGNTITEVQLGLSKQLFNDRLTVQVGGNVNVNSENALLVEGANFSSIAGNFVLEYRLTESGNYRLRVFRKENYDALNQSNVARTGVSFFFKKSFQNKKNRKRKEQPDKTKDAADSDAVRSGEQSQTIQREN